MVEGEVEGRGSGWGRNHDESVLHSPRDYTVADWMWIYKACGGYSYLHIPFFPPFFPA
jgi:hypothetical protein